MEMVYCPQTVAHPNSNQMIAISDQTRIESTTFWLQVQSPNRYATTSHHAGEIQQYETFFFV